MAQQPKFLFRVFLHKQVLEEGARGSLQTYASWWEGLIMKFSLVVVLAFEGPKLTLARLHACLDCILVRAIKKTSL
jgi:hypothetical protein